MKRTFIIILLVCFSCSVREGKKTDKNILQYYTCCEYFKGVTYNDSTLKTKMDECIVISFAKRDEMLSDFVMNLQYLRINGIPRIYMSISIYENLNSTKAKQRHIEIADSSFNSSTIVNLKTKLPLRILLSQKCIKGFSDSISSNGNYQVYAKSSDGENCFHFTDPNGALKDKRYVAIENNFNDGYYFKFTKNQLLENGKHIKDSLFANLN